MGQRMLKLEGIYQFYEALVNLPILPCWGEFNFAAKGIQRGKREVK